MDLKYRTKEVGFQSCAVRRYNLVVSQGKQTYMKNNILLKPMFRNKSNIAFQMLSRLWFCQLPHVVRKWNNLLTREVAANEGFVEVE